MCLLQKHVQHGFAYSPPSLSFSLSLSLYFFLSLSHSLYLFLFRSFVRSFARFLCFVITYLVFFNIIRYVCVVVVFVRDLSFLCSYVFLCVFICFRHGARSFLLALFMSAVLFAFFPLRVSALLFFLACLFVLQSFGCVFFLSFCLCSFPYFVSCLFSSFVV